MLFRGGGRGRGEWGVAWDPFETDFLSVMDTWHSLHFSISCSVKKDLVKSRTLFQGTLINAYKLAI